tara:strand:+ start:284 stop:481 length:198 start_codon:yes stop_codon:yes gene_type:complete
MIIFGRHLTIEPINGCGVFLELSTSRPVWVVDINTEEMFSMPFKGTMLYLPFLLITYGRVYDGED